VTPRPTVGPGTRRDAGGVRGGKADAAQEYQTAGGCEAMPPRMGQWEGEAWAKLLLYTIDGDVTANKAYICLLLP
jgi:hypothetical protein